jgi:tRNA (cytidine/uridine-2'-O-)-methyltransferase
MVSIALYQPDIPQNVGAMMRLCACMNVPLDIIEPCGFPWDEKKIRQAGLDYIDHVDYTRHESWVKFIEMRKTRRVILMTSHAATDYLDFSFESGDILLAGRESAGAPVDVHQVASARIGIKMAGGTRSLNIVNASAMILGEALRQTRSIK